MTTERKAELLDIIRAHVATGKTVLESARHCSNDEGERRMILEVLRARIPDTSSVRSVEVYDSLPGMTPRIRETWVRRALRREKLIIARAMA